MGEGAIPGVRLDRCRVIKRSDWYIRYLIKIWLFDDDLE